MSRLSVRLPDSLHDKVRELARRDGVSINQFIATAVAERPRTKPPKPCNQACDRVSTGPDMFLTVAARRVLERVEW